MKRKGITLIELLVTIFSASIIISTLSLSIYFTTKTSNDLVIDANNNYMMQSIREYIKTNKLTNENIILENGDLNIYIDSVKKQSFKNTNIKTIDINLIDSINKEYKCTIIFLGSYGEDRLEFKYFVS